jgi:signal transduction histidine kinase/PAS domain-containing protein
MSQDRWESFDDVDERVREVFAPVVKAVLMFGAAGLALVTPFFAQNRPGSLLLSLVVIVSASAAWLCMRRNRERPGAVLLIGTFWCVQSLIVLTSGGSFIGSSYVFTTLLAGLALGTRAMLVVGCLGLAVLAVASVLQATGNALPTLFPGALLARTSVAFLTLIGTMWVLGVFIRRTNKAFRVAGHQLLERQRSEQETQRRAEDLEEAQRLAQAGSWEYDVATAEHRWSRHHFRIHGLDPDTTVASFRAMIERVPPEDQDKVAAAFRAAYDPPYYVRGEYHVFGAAGDLRTIEGRVEGVRDASGKVVKLRGASVDITERRRIEELRGLELAVARCLAGVDEMAPAIRAAIATICEHEDWEIGGYWGATDTAGAIHLEHWWVRPRFAQAAEKVIEDALHNSYGSGVGLIGYAWRTGTGLWIPDIEKDDRVTRVALLKEAGLRSIAVMPITDGSRVVGVLVFAAPTVRARDETFMQTLPLLGNLIGQFMQRRHAEQQRRALQTQLYQSQKLQALGTLAGGIAHEFNNMIAVILGNASLAAQDVGDNPEVRESLDQITAAAERARALTRRILLFGRAQVDTRTSMPLGPLIQDVMRLLRATLPPRITLSLDEAADVPPVRADATQLHQLIVNLCTNSAHAIGNEAGTIGISLKTVAAPEVPMPALPSGAGEYVCLAVKDSGCGIDPQVRDRIFEPFFTTKRVGEGAGLGLSVVHSIVQGHEGAIDLDSAPGEGTTFRVYLPVAASAAAQLTEAAAAADVRGSGAHIFYVDDDPTIVSAMERMLSRRGYRVSAFTSARTALQKLREPGDKPSLLVSDYNMSEMSGLDMAREALQALAGLPILIVSGFIEERVERAGRALGVRGFVHKPDLQEMCAAIDRLAASS